MRGGGAALLAAVLLSAPASAQQPADRTALLLLVDGLTFDEALTDPAMGALARAGGIGLMTNADPLEPPDALPSLIVSSLASTDRLDEALRGAEGESLVIVAATGSEAGVATPVIVARGEPADLLTTGREPRGLTSDTTGRDGVVSNLDLEPTIRAFLGAPPGDAPGSPIRVESEAPAGLAERYAEWRRSSTPVGLTALILALASLTVALALLLSPWSGPAARAVSVWVLFSTAVLVALLPAGLLPDLRAFVVLPAVMVAAAAITWATLALARGSDTRPVALVAGIGLVLVVLDAVLGWPMGLTPFLGGSALEGVRFFGLGNPSAGVVLAGSVLVSALLRPWAGVALLVGAALFAGLPFLGADLGGGLTLFAAAALWYALRVRGRFGWPEVGLVAAALLAGLAILVVAHSAFPSPAEHVTRTVEGAGPAEIADVFLDRLRSNVETTSGTPAAWLAVLGLPGWLAVVGWRLGPFREPLDRDPVWRHAVAILAVGGMLGYVLNDTYGMAAVAFVFLSGAIVVPSVRWTSG